MTIDASDTHGRATAPAARDPVPRRAADAPAGPARSGMDREARRRIGRNLRILYADVLDMPLPDRFEALLAELSGQAASREDS